MSRTLSCVVGPGLGRITMEETKLLDLKEVGLVGIMLLFVYSFINKAVEQDDDVPR